MSTSSPEKLPNICVIGPGLIGASIGLALKASGIAGRVVTLGHRAETVEIALRRGAFDEGFTDPARALAGAGLVVVATPLSNILPSFELIKEHCAEGVTVTDTGSTKASVVAAAHDVFGFPGRIIGAHPMAGSEKAGPDNARADLFRGKTCVLTLVPHDKPDAVALTERFWGEALGMKLVHMTPEEHDTAVASVSHLPHLASAAIVRSADRIGGLDVAGSGFADTTRIAAGSPALWTDIFRHNRQALLNASERLQKELARFTAAIERDDPVEIENLLREAANRRVKWEKRHAAYAAPVEDDHAPGA